MPLRQSVISIANHWSW